MQSPKSLPAAHQKSFLKSNSEDEEAKNMPKTMPNLRKKALTLQGILLIVFSMFYFKLYSLLMNNNYLELIQASREARANQSSLPESLLGKIKVKPPPPKRSLHHSHIMNDVSQLQDPFHGLYSTKTKSREAVGQIQDKNGQVKSVAAPSRSFKEKLVEFIM
jgi:hypothetical protein